MSDKRVSRRAFLRGAAAVGGVALVAACGPTPTPQIIKEVVKEVVKETVVVEKPVEKVVKETVVTEKQVEKLVTKEVVKEVVKEVTPTGGEVVVPFLTSNWNWQKLNMANATEFYNQQNRGKVRIQCDPAPSGWETKVREMVKAGKMQWGGQLCSQSILGEISLVRMGIIEDPMPYVKGSKLKWAAQFDQELVAAARKYFTFEGKLWAIPWDMEVFVRHYRTEEWGKLGAKPAETLDEWNKQLLELKKMFPKKTPLVLARAGDDPDVNNLLQMWTTEPWILSDGQWCLNCKSDAYAEYLKLYKFWYDNKIMTDDSWSSQTYTEVWNKGDGMTTATSAAWCFATARKIFGYEAIACMPNAVLQKGNPPRGHTFTNAAWLFKGGPRLQEATDWLLWMLDPTVESITNYGFYKGDMDYYHLPVYKTAYEKLVPKDPAWSWMTPILPQVNNSITIPTEAYRGEWIAAGQLWEDKFVHGKCTLKEAQEGTWNDAWAQLKKVLAQTK